MNAPVFDQQVRSAASRSVATAGADRAQAAIPTFQEHSHPVVIVGGGPSGIRVAQELCRAGLRAVLLNAERWQPYNRVKLTPLLCGDVQIGQVTQALDFQGPGQVDLYSNTSVVEIDRPARTVTTRQGRKWPYSKLVICTGSRAHIPNIPGSELAGVFTFRNFDDVEKLLARSVRSRRCVVVGGGLLGLEAARGMMERGVETLVVEHEAHLMARQLDARAGDRLAEHVQRMGIDVLTGTAVKAFLGRDRIEAVELAGERTIDCDTVILCTGVRPNMEFARDIGLAVGRGIKVDGALRTSDPDIYAVGECAEFEGRIYGLVGPCYEQAVAAANHIAGVAGKAASYKGSVPATKLKIVGIDVFSMGDVEQLEQRNDVRTLVFEDDANGIYRRVVLRRGHLVGAIAIGDWSEMGRLQEAIRTRGLLLPWQERRFLATGLIWPERAPASARDWPRAQTVCNCTGVTRGQIGDAISLGARSLDDVKRDTGASTVCGSCKVHIGEILDAPAVREPVVGWRLLSFISAAATVLALLTLMLPIWPTAVNIGERGLADSLFLDGIVKQWTGYTLLAFSALAALISLRKRIPPMARLGDYASWRVIHLIVGAAALVVLFAHTGFRLGSNLNFWLMASFLGLAIAGALAGLATSLEHRLLESPRAAASLRNAAFWLHLITFWPLPLLLSVHILTVYFY